METEAIGGGIDRGHAVFLLGGSLILLNFLLTGAGQRLFFGLLGKATLPGGASITTTVTPRELGMQGLFLLALYGLSQLDDSAGSFALALVGGLWVLWLFNMRDVWGAFLAGNGPAPAAPAAPNGPAYNQA